MGKVRALRGATTIDNDEPDHIRERVAALLGVMFERNQVDFEDLISVFFSVTSDLHSLFPAAAARAAFPDIADTPLINMCEVDIEGALARCIRVMAHLYTDRSKAELQHVFLEGAVVLRPDLLGMAAHSAGSTAAQSNAAR